MKKIYLSGKYGHLFALVDDEDYEHINQWKWSYSGGYASRYTKGIQIGMHNEIMEGKGIDHINHDKLDNRRENLRYATRSQNGYNRKPPGNKKYKGVGWNKSCNKYYARITFNGGTRHLGVFETEKEAILAYNEAALKYHGEFAYLNVLEGE